MQPKWRLCAKDLKIEAKRLQEFHSPILLIGSPKCTAFSNLLNFKSAKEHTFTKLRTEGLDHLNQVLDMYETQLACGRYFLHEHLKCATSWRLPCMQEMLDQEETYFADSDLCRFGLFHVVGISRK